MRRQTFYFVFFPFSFNSIIKSIISSSPKKLSQLKQTRDQNVLRKTPQSNGMKQRNWKTNEITIIGQIGNGFEEHDILMLTIRQRITLIIVWLNETCLNTNQVYSIGISEQWNETTSMIT